MTNKQAGIYFKNAFGKQAIICNKKYPYLLASSIAYDIPYDFINRCYIRYIKNMKEQNTIHQLSKDGYNIGWFELDKAFFQMAIKIWIVNHDDEYGHYKYKKYSRGDISIKVADISGFSKWISLYTNMIEDKNEQY